MTKSETAKVACQTCQSTSRFDTLHFTYLHLGNLILAVVLKILLVETTCELAGRAIEAAKGKKFRKEPEILLVELAFLHVLCNGKIDANGERLLGIVHQGIFRMLSWRQWAISDALLKPRRLEHSLGQPRPLHYQLGISIIL